MVLSEQTEGSFEDGGRSRPSMLYICTGSPHQGISWSQTVCKNTLGLSLCPPPLFQCVCEGKEID